MAGASNAYAGTRRLCVCARVRLASLRALRAHAKIWHMSETAPIGSHCGCHLRATLSQLDSVRVCLFVCACVCIQEYPVAAKSAVCQNYHWPIFGLSAGWPWIERTLYCRHPVGTLGGGKQLVRARSRHETTLGYKQFLDAWRERKKRHHYTIVN